MTVIKSTCNKAWLVSGDARDELRIICPDGVTTPIENIMRGLKPHNADKFKLMSPGEQYNMFIRMMSIKGGVRLTSDEVNYIGLDSSALHGKVFLGGLGLGLDVLDICKNDSVSEVVIVEQTAGVIELIKPRLLHKKISIHKGNPLQFFPDCNYDFMFWAKYQYWLFDDCEMQVTQNYIKSKHINNYD